MTEDRRRIIAGGARLLFATAIGALAVSLGLRRGKTAGTCDRAGRCGGCRVTDQCDLYQAITPPRKP